MANLWNVAKKAYALLFVLSALFAIAFVVYILIKNWREILPSISLLLPILITIYFLYKYTSLQGPMKHFANRLFLGAYNLLIYRRRFLWEQLYDFLCYVIPSTEWKHMNWGYAPMSQDGIMLRNLKKEDENERYSIQLYHYMATCLNKWENLENKTLMEVSSGRGGGIDYLSRYLNPKKCIGVDISQVQIDYCRNIYRNNSKLMFVNGDSQALSRIPDLRNEAIDIVINVESGHCYPDFKRFLQEVDRVLVPGGYFAYSDFRPSHEWEKVEDQLESFSMKIVQKVNISDNVMHSLTLDEDRKRKLIQNRLSPALRFFFNQIGGVKGSHIFEGLSKKTMKSMAYVLQKPEVKKT